MGRHRSVGAEAARKHACADPLGACSVTVQQLAGWAGHGGIIQHFVTAVGWEQDLQRNHSRSIHHPSSSDGEEGSVRER